MEFHFVSASHEGKGHVHSIHSIHLFGGPCGHGEKTTPSASDISTSGDLRAVALLVTCTT